MNFDKEEFNEYGVRNNYQKEKQKNSSNLNISVVVAVTVLFSVFNFVVGYMVGKFLGNAKSSDVSISDVKETKGYSEIIGIPSSKNETTNAKLPSQQEEISIDLDEEKIVEGFPKTAPNYEINNPKPKTLTKKSQSDKSHSDKSLSDKSLNDKSLNSKSQSDKSQGDKSQKVKYFIQVSSNERKDVAQSTLSKLKSFGLNGFIQETQVGGKKVYRVRIGEFYSYEEAIKVLDRARKVNVDAFLVVSK